MHRLLGGGRGCKVINTFPDGLLRFFRPRPNGQFLGLDARAVLTLARMVFALLAQIGNVKNKQAPSQASHLMFLFLMS